MVAKTPPKLRRMAAPLNPNLLRETVKKVDQCMARLQELQYTVSGGTKVISGVSLSPRSTRGYLRTSLRCKQESLRIKNAAARKSPVGKFQGSTNLEEWRRMSLPAMLVGETVGEILQASRFARGIVAAVAANTKQIPSDDPKTPVTQRRNRTPCPENPELRTRRNKEKQVAFQLIRSETNGQSIRRARSRIDFKGEGVLDVIDVAVSQWVGIVVLDGSLESGGCLYEAACLLKSVVRDRAYLLISKRVDIAAAVDANGILLSDQGLPPIIAKKMMVQCNADGTNCVEVLVNPVQNVNVLGFTTVSFLGQGTLLIEASKLLLSGASGLVISLEDMKLFSDDVMTKLFNTVSWEEKGHAVFTKLEDRKKTIKEIEADFARDNCCYLQSGTTDGKGLTAY
ncbi:hypothetical protein NE237_013193 [Protea cynaroides]|uniref:Uncharacterized protein n=1 Tax=Protea cynaroides TaxID=273540 RepID=A0A9Q0H1K1_9MAGN|nr:hypothetical protein NE237_013193 [Protea cynaroides]